MAYVVQYIHFWGAEIPIETHTELVYTLYVYIYMSYIMVINHLVTGMHIEEG